MSKNLSFEEKKKKKKRIKCVSERNLYFLFLFFLQYHVLFNIVIDCICSLAFKYVNSFILSDYFIRIRFTVESGTYARNA